MREATRGLQLMIVPFLKIRDRMLGKEVGRDAFMRYFPGRCLGAILAKFKHARICGLGPSAADAHVTVWLVLLEQNQRSCEWYVVAAQTSCERADRTPASGRGLVWLDLEVGT